MANEYKCDLQILFPEKNETQDISCKFCANSDLDALICLRLFPLVYVYQVRITPFWSRENLPIDT